MNSSKNRTLPPLGLVSPSELEKALLVWDELDDASLVTLASHPQSAERLSLLRDAQHWLHDGAGAALRARKPSATCPSTPCPSATDLFDQGRGPGFSPLSRAASQAIEDHLEDCAECRALVASLASPPPVPLATEQVHVPEHEQAGRHPTPARALTPSNTWVPFLLAAGLAGLVLLPPFLGRLRSEGPDLPAHPVYRGAESGGLLFPRGKLLVSASAPEFELRAVPNVSRYRVEVYARGASAFDEGHRVQVLYSGTPRFYGEALSTGSYTFQAFAEIDQLDRALGALDFELVDDEALGQELARMMTPGDASSEEERTLLIRKLEGLGFSSDARKLAHLLPDTPAKRAFLRAPSR